MYFHGTIHVSWILWKTEFQINSYHTISSDKNFTKNTDKIVASDQEEVFQGTISEIQFASGDKLSCMCEKYAPSLPFHIFYDFTYHFYFQLHPYSVPTIVCAIISSRKRPMY